MYEALYIKKLILLIKKVCKDLVSHFLFKVCCFYSCWKTHNTLLLQSSGGYMGVFWRFLWAHSPVTCAWACKQEQVRQGSRCFTHNTVFLMEMQSNVSARGLKKIQISLIRLWCTHLVLTVALMLGVSPNTLHHFIRIVLLVLSPEWSLLTRWGGGSVGASSSYTHSPLHSQKKGKRIAF